MRDLSDLTARLEGARQRLPLKRLMESRGRGPANGNWKSFPQCPYCGGAQCAGVFDGAHGDFFKCHRTGCRSGTAGERAAWDEIGFLAFELNLDRRRATRAWLEEVGLWDEKPASAGGKPVAGGEDQNPHSSADDQNSSPKPALLAFYERLSLSDADRQELKTKRGLSDEMIERSGFRSNDQSNLAILEALALEYPEYELVQCGLYTRKGHGCKPSGQFYGWGVVGKKKRLPEEWLESGEYDDLEDDEIVWANKESGQCNPILIPYFDPSGQLIGLRPHKGFPKGQKPRLYLAGGRQMVRPCCGAVIVEGEFKAAALQDMVGQEEWAAAGVPGITQVKNLHVWADLLVWLKRIWAQTVAVVFDNEEHKDRPLEDRSEAEIWARVCAVRLAKEGYDARVGHLPDDWRNGQGKADWDGALAAFLQAGKTRQEIAPLFLNVLQRAIRVGELSKAKLFEPAAERIIADRVEVRAHPPALPWGGQAEQKVAKELRRLAAGKLRDWAGRIIPLAKAYEETWGWYYELRISEQRAAKLENELRQTDKAESVLFLDLALKGTPHRVAPLRVVPCYVLVKPDGRRDRVVRLVNDRHEQSGLVALDEDSLTAPRDWRRWLATKGNYGWEGGERALQALQRDINFVLGRREVTQLICYGCERPGGLWFVDDCAYADDGALVLPDAQGIFRHQGRGYTFLRDQENLLVGDEGQSFRLKNVPRMQPGWGLVLTPAGKLELKEGVADDPAALQELLGDFVLHLNDSYGGYDGLLLIAATVAFFGGPEIYRLRAEFPGIWITGEKGSGKTYTARWTEAMHGFSELEAGLSFKTSSAVGAQIALGQCANIPVWGDEFKENELRDPNVRGVIHSGFNREIPSKYSENGRSRTIRTNFLLTGETSCANAATMSRYVSVVAARERRTGTPEEQRVRLEWLQEHRKFFFTIGRAVLRQRAKFTARMLEHLSAWERLPELSETDARGRFSHGVAYSAFLALNEIIPIYPAKACAQFQEWLIEKTTTANREVAERVKLNQFFKDLLSMLASGWFGKTPEELGRYFRIAENKKGQPQFSERQRRDAAADARCHLIVPWLAFQPGPVIALWNKYHRVQGLELPPSQADLRAELQVRPCFVEGPRQGHRMKFGPGAKTNSYCWVFNLAAEFEELGYRAVSDEVWENSFHREGNPENGRLPMDEWVDPRKGELFAFVDGLKKEQLL
jgi:hypothetical protein